VGRRYHEPSVPHIYQAASVVHRFHRMLRDLGKDRVSVQLCFGCFAAIEQIDSVPFFSGALALYLRHTRKDAVGRKQP
jgi:hypothetical protein